jgi:hypothetical protein
MPKAIGIEAEDAGRYVRVGFGPGEVGHPYERAVCKKQQLGEMYTASDIWIPLVHEGHVDDDNKPAGTSHYCGNKLRNSIDGG